MQAMQDQKAGQAQVQRTDAQSRYEIVIGDELAAWAEYRQEDGCVRFTHTQVQQAHEGQGLASKLVAQALDDVRRRGMRIVPQCRFVASDVARHEREYADLVER